MGIEFSLPRHSWGQQRYLRDLPATRPMLARIPASCRIHVTTRSGAPEETAADTRVVGLFEGESLADERLQRLVELGEAKPEVEEVAVAHEDAPAGSAAC